MLSSGQVAPRPRGVSGAWPAVSRLSSFTNTGAVAPGGPVDMPFSYVYVEGMRNKVRLFRAAYAGYLHPGVATIG